MPKRTWPGFCLFYPSLKAHAPFSPRTIAHMHSSSSTNQAAASTPIEVAIATGFSNDFPPFFNRRAKSCMQRNRAPPRISRIGMQRYSAGLVSVIIIVLTTILRFLHRKPPINGQAFSYLNINPDRPGVTQYLYTEMHFAFFVWLCPGKFYGCHWALVL